jgi:hypothetical protein
MVPKHAADMLCNVHKPKQAAIFPMEKICVSDKLGLGQNYSAVDCEFRVNELTIYIK